MSDFSELTKETPEKSLTVPLSGKGGRNNNGKITQRHGRRKDFTG